MTEQKRDDQGQFTSADWFSALVAGSPPVAGPEDDLPGDWLTAALRGAPPTENPIEPATDPPADTPTAATEPNPDPTAAWLDALTCPSCHSRRNPSPHITHTEKGQHR